MNPTDKAHLLEIYSKTLAEHGDAPEAVQLTAESQRLRFQLLSEIAPLENSSILDYGCGKGDQYAYLRERGFRGSYTGFDINEDLLAVARRKHSARFALWDIEAQPCEERFDYVLISGMFNNRISDNGRTMKSVLRACFACANQGLAFNAISTYVNFRQPEMSYASPEEMFRFCMTELSPAVTLRHDAMPYNFTMYVYRRRELSR